MRRLVVTAGLLGLVAGALVSAGPGLVSAAAVPSAPSVASSAGTYVPVTPARTLDTRSHVGASAPAARATVSWQATGHGGIPSSGVSAVVFNLSVLSPPAGGYVTAWADGVARPTASSISYSAGKSETVLAIAPVGSDGKVALYNGSTATQQIVGDVAGFYVAGRAGTPGAFTAVGPARTLDTRTSVGARAPASRQTVSWQATGAGGVPSSGVSSVVFNLSVLSPASGGYVTAFADGTTRPTASSISYSAHKTENVLVEVPVGSNGKVALYNGSTTTQQLVGDVAGYYLAGTPSAPGTFVPLTPSRALDTRTSVGASAPAAGGTVTWAALGHGGVPSSGVSAVVFNLSVLSPASKGYVVAYPNRTLRPTASSISYIAHKSENNLVVVPVGSDGRIAFYNGSTTSQQLVGDVAGYYRAAPPLSWSAPTDVMPSQGGLAAVSCASTTFCAAVDDAGDALTYDGSAWSAPVKVDTYGLLVDVSCPSATFCAAIDASSNALIYNGTGWSAPHSIDPGTYLSAVSCVSGTFCVAVDGNGDALTWNGTSWSAPRVVDAVNSLDDVSCVTTSFCVATDGSEQTYSVFTGSSWSAPKDSKAPGDRLSCASTTYCLATDGSSAATFNGTTWSTVTDPPSDVEGLSCAAAGACTAVDSSGEAFTLSGSTWSDPVVIESASDQGLRGVACTSTTFCVAVGDEAHVYQGSGWDAGTDVDPQLGGIDTMACPTTSFCAAGNDTAQVATWSSGTWSAPHAPESGTTIYSAGLSCVSASFCLVADSADHTFVYDGSTWTRVADTGGEDMFRVSCATSTFCIGIANGSDLVRWNGTAWALSTRLANPPRDVSCVSASFCVAVTTSGSAYTWNGSTWSAGTSVDTAGRVSAVSCSSSTACAVTDAAGHVVMYRNGAWAAPLSVSSTGLADVSCSTDRSCVAVTASDGVSPGAALAFNGVVWSAPTAIDPSPSLDVVACAAGVLCMAGDGQGRAIEGATGG